MLTWALAERLRGMPVTANADSPGVRGHGPDPERGWAAQGRRGADELPGADAAGRCGHDHLAGGQPGGGGVTGKFWKNRREVRCRFRDPAAVEQLWTLVAQQAGLAAEA